MQIKYDLDKVGIGSRLQEERIRAGHTQESLAEAMGITDKYISKVENGAAAPSPFVRYEVFRYYQDGCSLSSAGNQINGRKIIRCLDG